MKSYTHT